MDEKQATSEEPEQPAYLTLAAVAAALDVRMGTLYNYLRDLEIITFKAGRDRHSYIRLADFLRLREYIAEPWRFKVEQRRSRRQPPPP